MSEERFYEDLQDVLARYFEIEEQGETPELLAICGGNRELMSRARAILDSENISLALLKPPSTSEIAPEERTEFPEIDGFRIVQEIGSGGMGRVYLAEQIAIGRLVAIKVIDVGASAAERARFLREARTAAALDHKNIVPVYGFGDAGGRPYIVMRWISGLTLDAAAVGASRRDIAEIGAKVARALDEAHRSGILHRDIKPTNIILEDGEPFVVDFGLARAATDPTLTKQGGLVGTLLYMAPEQLSSDRPAFDPRTDVYSLGATLYEMIAQRPIFDLEDRNRLVARILDSEPAPLGLSGLDKDLETIVIRAVAKEPERRFPTALAMAEDLERWLARRPILSRRIGVVGRIDRLARRHPRVAVATIIALAFAVTAVGKINYDRKLEEAGYVATMTDIDRRITMHEVDLADAAVRAIPKRFEDDPRTVAAAKRLAAELALEDLMDLLSTRAELLEPEQLAPYIRNVDDSMRYFTDRRYAEWILTLAHRRCGQLDSALRSLANARRADAERRVESRATEALTILLDGKTPFPTLTITSANAMEHFVVAMALGYGGVTGQRVEEEINRARELDPDWSRLKLHSAMTAYNADRFDLALGMFLGIAPRRRLNDALNRCIVTAAVTTGRYDVAEKMMAQISQESRCGADIQNIVWIERALRGWNAALKVLDDAESDPKLRDSPEVRYQRAVALMFAEKWTDAEKKARAAAADFKWGPSRENAMATAIDAKLRGIIADETGPAGTTPIIFDPSYREMSEECSDIVPEIQQLLEKFQNGLARSQLTTILARIHALNARYSEAFSALEQAITEDRSNFQPHIDYALLALALGKAAFDPKTKDSVKVSAGTLNRGWIHALITIEMSERSRSPTPPMAVLRAFDAVIDFADAANDVVELRKNHAEIKRFAARVGLTDDSTLKSLVAKSEERLARRSK